MIKSSLNAPVGEEPKHVYRLPPCPAYDIEGMESWLSDMAANGLLLSADGFFAGFAIFERSEPRAVRYRLEAAPKNVSMWADGGCAPDDEAVGLNEAYGWRYVASRGQFYIYRAETADARELNTDPRVQALALDMVRRRERGNLISSFAWMLVYPAAMLRGKLLLTALDGGTGMFLTAAALILWAFFASVSRVVHLRRLRTKLSAGEAISHSKKWRTTAWRYRAGGLLFLACIIAWTGLLLHNWSEDTMRVNERPLAGYTAPLPFATIADLMPGGQLSLDNTGYGNTVELDSDWLAPTIIALRQNATVKLPDGRSLSGGLYVDYYETAAPWLAREIAREYLSADKKSSHYRELQLPELDVDYAVAYDAILPTLIVQEGGRAMRVTFYQTSGDYEVPFDVWVRIFAESIK